MYTNYFVRQWLVFVTHMQELRPVLSGSIPQLLSNTNSEKTCFWCVFRARLGKNLSRTCLGVVCCIFRLFRQETCTHIFTFACTFQFAFVKFTQKNTVFVLFWGGVKKRQQQISDFGCPVGLRLWNYSRRFGSLKNTKNCMYVYKHMFYVSAFWNSTQLCFFLCFFFQCFWNCPR